MTVNTPWRSGSLEYAEWDSPVRDIFTIIARYGDRDNKNKLMGPFASECVLQFYVQNYSASSTNGTFVEKPQGGPVYLNGTDTFEAEIVVHITLCTIKLQMHYTPVLKICPTR
ncbi:hypothetical protein LTR70_005671 [Exophiala xenobiotica]|uniref:Uncharacterized protein n=1 Tax=Lithohypha guttulata TaxID=1690604 RepID=A0ABR0K3H7_9EURO|nr:hypothetical protein LTR24_007269 [Lithohypha guttulata]KAK5317990.1 hypothetical protein LTR70_005671 [Exophiala xenobiotica]